MEKREGSVFILSKLNLDDIEEVVWEPYHKDGAGRPPRNPLGIFKALIVKRLRHIPSDRELYRRLWNDPELRHICDIEAEEKAYHPSQLTRFRRRVKKLVADSQYSSKRFRKNAADCGLETVIPYPANQRPNERRLLRVDKHFRTHGSARERRIYRRRASIERMISRLKEQLGLDGHKVRGLRNIAIHVLLCLITMLLIAVAAFRLKRVEKIRSIAGW